MSFYRPATADDFEDFDVEYSNFSHMDNWTRKKIEEGDIPYAIKAIRQQTGIGLVECRKYCLKYQAYAFAKRDFEEGKPVFVAY